MQAQRHKLQLLDVDGAANYLHVKPRTVRHMIQTRSIPYHKVGALVRIATEDLDAYLAAHRVEVGGAA